MGYKIAYSQETAYKFPIKQAKKFSVRWVIAGALAIGLLAGGWKWLLPGDPDKTQAALATLTEDIRAGQSLGQAITAFCQEIVDNAQ